MAWAEGLGGAAADAVSFELTIYGKAEYPLILKGLRAKIVGRSSPPAGTLFTPAGAGDLPQRPVNINLDSRDPIAEPQPDNNGPWEFPLQVSAADAERIFVTASTASGDYRFVIEVDYTDNGPVRKQVIDNYGKPFRVASSVAASAQASWRISGNQVTVAANG
jgi:hypothetical protein